MFRLEASQVPGRPALPLPLLSDLASSKYASAQTSIAATPLRACSPSLPIHQEPSRQLAKPPPQHRMCRSVRTVEDLWYEWTVGLQGQPSICELDRRWGSLWRAGRQSELQWYSLRLEVIKEIRHVAQARRTSEDAAMWQVNQRQQQQRCSLDQFCKLLRAARRN